MNIITNKDVFSEENISKMPKKVGRRGRPPKMSNPNNSNNSQNSANSAPQNPNRPGQVNDRSNDQRNNSPRNNERADRSNAPIIHVRGDMRSGRPEQRPNNENRAASENKNVFYQAARPKKAPKPNTPTPPAGPVMLTVKPGEPEPGSLVTPDQLMTNIDTSQPIDPRLLASRLARQHQDQNNNANIPSPKVETPREGAQVIMQPSQPLKPRAPRHQINSPISSEKHQNDQTNHPAHAEQNGRFTTIKSRPGRGQMPADGAGTFISRATNTGESLNVSFEENLIRSDSNIKLKIIPLGGLEEIGKNMTLLEYGNDILIVDMGFMFPDSDMLGVDYIIPDVSYLDDKKDRIRGALITHGHLDHIGAIPYIVERLGFPTMYGTIVTMGMVKQRLSEFGLEAKNKMVNIEAGKDVLQLGAFKVRSFKLVHSVPGAIGLEIETPNGRLVYATDWKFDYNPADNVPVDLRELAACGARGVDLLLSDSTNADRPGHSISEKVVEQALSSAIGAAQGRIIIAMFSSNLSRIQQTINAAYNNGRKVLIVGRSMQQNVEMAISIKAIVVPPNTIVSEREINRFHDEKVLIISTGAQGEDRSALSRMANGEHKIIKIKKGDTVIISASPIPGNERSVSSVMHVLYKAGAEVIYNKVLDVHTSGHANQEDLKLMLALMRPRYFVPLHGERSKLIIHGKLAEEVGVAPSNIIIGDNGMILEMDNTGVVRATDSHVPAGYVMVDGLGVGDVGNIVLKDRQAMAQEGIFVVFSVYDKKAGKFLNSPDIISRGFIYMRENEKFVNDVRNEIKNFLAKASAKKNPDLNNVRNELRDHLSKMLYEKTERQPMVIPVITEV